MASLKSNVILNFLNTLTSIIFPIITFPYAARVLSPDGIGSINFLSSIISYIVLLTSIGIPLYAVREIAKYRDNVDLRNKITTEILILSLILSVAGYFIVVLLGELVPQIYINRELFYTLSSSIILTSIGVNWFYQAIEDFKYITIRALIVRTLSALCLFVFVKDKSDLFIYSLVLVGTNVGNNFWNFIHLRKYINLSIIKFRELQPFKHLSPALRIFVLNLIISIYVGLDTIMLGFMQGDKAVGYYTAGIKLTHVVLSLVTSLGAVMLPRCANLVQTGNMQGFSDVTRKAARFVIAVSLPICIGLIILATPITNVFFGNEFASSSNVLMYSAPIIVFTGLTNVIGIQILYPQGLERIVIYSVMGGAVINLILNIILIPIIHQDGAAIATFFAELMVLLIQWRLGLKYLPFKWSSLEVSNYLIASITIVLFSGISLYVFTDNWWIIIVSVIGSICTYSLTLFLRKDMIFLDMVNMILKKKYK